MASACDVSSAPVLALEAQNSPRDVRHRRITGTHVHARRSKRRVRFGVAGEMLTFKAKPSPQQLPFDHRKSNEKQNARHWIALGQVDTSMKKTREGDLSLFAFERSGGLGIEPDVEHEADDS